MTKQEVINLRIELNKVLEKFNKTSDIKMTLGNASFDTEVTFKLVGNAIVNGKIITKKSENFKSYQCKHGLKLQALNYEFAHQGKTISITGYNTRAKRHSIEYKINNSNFKCSVEYIKQIFKQSAPELLI